MAGTQGWLWDPIHELWKPAPYCVVSKRLDAPGLVISGPHELYWMHPNPSAGATVVELTDAIVALGAVVFDHVDSTKDGHMMPFNPPMHFDNGIFLETFTNLTSVTFGYV